MIISTCGIAMIFKHLIHAVKEGLLSRFYVCCGISTSALGFTWLLLLGIFNAADAVHQQGGGDDGYSGIFRAADVDGSV